MPSPLEAQLPAIKSTLKLYKISSMVTGIFLLVISTLFVLRLTLESELWAFGPNGLLTLEKFMVDDLGVKVGLPTSGLNLTSAALIIHGWLYVLYLYTDFRLWTLLRWSFGRFILIAAGGVVPFLSFFTERHFAKVAAAQLSEVSH
ncbi:MAG: DUF3817 domain-containing protein [Micrococcales bacterium]